MGLQCGVWLDKRLPDFIHTEENMNRAVRLRRWQAGGETDFIRVQLHCGPSQAYECSTRSGESSLFDQ